MSLSAWSEMGIDTVQTERVTCNSELVATVHTVSDVRRRENKRFSIGRYHPLEQRVEFVIGDEKND